MEDKLIIKYIKKKKEKGLELLIDNYSGLITYIVKENLCNVRNHSKECINDMLW